MEISSLNNPRIKEAIKLEKASERKNRKLFVAEGYREISKAFNAGFDFETIFYCPDLISEIHAQFLKRAVKAERISVSHKVYEKMAYRENTDGLIGIGKWKEPSLEDIPAKSDGLYLVIETVEKPGNLGAILRTADAAGVDAVIVCDSQTDLYNPNVIRSSLGCLFTNRVINTSTEECISFLKERRIHILAAALQNSRLYYDTDMRKSTAIVLGSEDKGLSESWRKAAGQIIRIPMLGEADSLNVSVSAAILTFEAIRQRNLAKKQEA